MTEESFKVKYKYIKHPAVAIEPSSLKKSLELLKKI